MVGFATMTLSTSSVRADETVAQSSYPLKSENAIPPGDFSEYLSCAYRVVATRTTSTATAAVTPIRKPAERVLVLRSCCRASQTWWFSSMKTPMDR
jgi:hypothetical protein